MKAFSKLYKLSWLLAAILIFTACSKELSFETDGNILPITPPPDSSTAEGVFVNTGGTCGNFKVVGIYGKGLILDTANKATVELNFSKVGTYIISTDTLNGMYFYGYGTVSATGVATITLQAIGTPAAIGDYSYNVGFKGSSCSFQVKVFAVAVVGTADYFPMTTASSWTYRSNDPTASPTDTAMQLSTGLQGTLPDGTIYNLFTFNYGDPNNLDSSFYRKQGNNYHELGDVDAAGLADQILTSDFIFLKDNVNVGDKWESALLQGTTNAGTTTIKTKRMFELLANNVKVVVNDFVYQNTIKVNVTQVVENASGGFDSILVYQTWYAKGVGLINLMAPAPAYGYSLVKFKVN